MTIFAAFTLAGTEVRSAECLDLNRISANVPPPELAQDIRNCIENGNFAPAMQLFYIYSSYGLFDQQRVRDDSAHIVLSESRQWIFGGWNATVMAGLRDVAAAMRQADDPVLLQVCRWLQDNGPPNYRPGYMIIRGMIPRKSDDDWMTMDFDPQRAWARALHEVNNCPR